MTEAKKDGWIVISIKDDWKAVIILSRSYKLNTRL
jgi:hypothetical protein